MMKRGQVTVFVILGIVIVSLIVLFMFARKTILLPMTPENLQSEIDSIAKDVQDCMLDLGEDPIRDIGLRGGYLHREIGYRLFNDTRISYLCHNIENDDRCYNDFLTLQKMESQLNEELRVSFSSCLDLGKYARLKPFKIKALEDPKVETTIMKDKVIVDLRYPIMLESKKTDLRSSRDRFTVNFNYPLGELYDVSQDIVESEVVNGEFDPLPYMLVSKGKYKIYKHRPYPDKIYILMLMDKDYLFQFAVEGEAR